MREVLETKGVRVTDAEWEKLSHQWKIIESLKNGFHHVELNEADIALTYEPGGECDEVK
ncbi:MAG TPA: hypothetical protein VIR13_01425 [Savagea sp.]